MLPASKKSSIFDVVGLAGFAPSQGSQARRKRSSEKGDNSRHALLASEESGPKVNPFEDKPPLDLQEFVAEPPKGRSLDDIVLRFCNSKDAGDVMEDKTVSWGDIVVGQDAGDGWVTCGDVKLPVTVDGVRVLEHRRFEPVPVRKLKPWVQPNSIEPFVSEDDESHTGEDEEEAADQGLPKVIKSQSSFADSSEDSQEGGRGGIGNGIGDLELEDIEEEDNDGDPLRHHQHHQHQPHQHQHHQHQHQHQHHHHHQQHHHHQPPGIVEGSRSPSLAELTEDDYYDDDDEPRPRNGTKSVAFADDDSEVSPSSSRSSPLYIERYETVTRMPVESRLPPVEPSHWLASGGTGAPHLDPVRLVPDDLQEAVLRGDVTLVRRLIKAGVSVNTPVRTLQEEEFITLLHVLSSRASIPNGTRVLVELLKSKANPNTRSSLGATPLVFACLHKHMGAVEVLLEFGAESVAVDDAGRTAARCAMIPDPDVPNSEELSVELAKILCEWGTDLDHGGDVSPIVEAVSQHNHGAVKALIALKAHPDGLLEAVLNAPTAMIQDLITAMANPFVRDKSGKTVLEVALGRGEEQVTTMLRDYIGNLERSDHPHLLTRTPDDIGNQDWIPDMAFKSTNFEPKDPRRRFEGARKSLADRLFEQHVAAARPLTATQKYRQVIQRAARMLARSWTFQTIMLVFLFMALFISDVWILMNMTSSDPLDIMIIIIFVGFGTEFIVQCIGYRGNYVGKFTFWMDIVGWLSVPLDHSLVTDSILRGFEDKVDAPTLARLTKLVKLGARAGRISRLVKLLRFLPGMGDKGDHAGTAAVMSKLINMRISLQVAGIIIVMVIVLPLLDISRYPQVDNSMTAWANLVDAAAKEHEDQVWTMISDMQDFYSDLTYAPYQVYLIFDNGTNATVDLSDAPVRTQDRMTATPTNGHADTHATIMFNFRSPNFLDALMSVMLMCTIVVVIFLTAILVSNGVTHIVLRPLEKLLNVVKEVAGTIFTKVDNISRTVANKNREEDQDSDSQEGNEAKMLERVLKKLNALSELTVKKAPIEGFNDLTAADKSLMRDYNIRVVEEEPEGRNRQRLSVANQDRQKANDLEAKVAPKLGDARINWNDFLDWNFDITSYSRLQHESLGICLMHLYESPMTEPILAAEAGGAEEVMSNSSSLVQAPTPTAAAGRQSVAARRVSANTNVSGRRKSQAARRVSHLDDTAASIANFIMALSTTYADDSVAPYHTFAHALDVSLTLHRVFRAIHSECYLSMHERLGLIVAALAHDLGHNGFNNNFLIRTGDTLALVYNDKSPLENMHCARLFEITSKPGAHIFQKMDPVRAKDLRQVVIEAILATDPQANQALIKEMKMTYDIKTDMFDTLLDQMEHPERLPPFEVVDFMAKPENSAMLRRLFVHYCDQSNSFKAWHLCRKWGMLLLQEFWHQGDREEELGIPINPLFDRNKVHGARAMVSILEGCVVPLCSVSRNLFPFFFKCEDYLLENMSKWTREWYSEAKPTREEAQKVAERRGNLRRAQRERIDKLRRRAQKDKERVPE